MDKVNSHTAAAERAIAREDIKRLLAHGSNRQLESMSAAELLARIEDNDRTIARLQKEDQDARRY